MTRLTDNDRNLGPITIAPWKHRFEISLNSGDRDEGNPNNHIFICAFGWAIRIQTPNVIKPFGKYGEHARVYGFSITKGMTGWCSEGWDFMQVYYGPRTHDSSTEKCWSKSLPWKQWPCVRNSVYAPDGTLFATEALTRGRDCMEFYRLKEECPKSRFDFIDHDGKRITAECTIEEREWHRGSGWFTWMKWFWPAKIRRSLDLKFSEEVGPEKGSWKGGTTGTGIEMHEGETPADSFKRWCEKEHDARYGKKYRTKFVGSLP